jgi:hypothetical protein
MASIFEFPFRKFGAGLVIGDTARSDIRERPLIAPEAVPIKMVRDIYIPDLHIDTSNVKGVWNVG